MKINGALPQAAKYSVGYVHALSKRTAIYTNAAYLSNKDGASYGLNGATTAPNANAKGLDIGIRHIF